MRLAPRQSCVWKLLDWTEYKEGESSFFADEFYLRLMQHGGDSIIEFLKSFFYAGFRGAWQLLQTAQDILLFHGEREREKKVVKDHWFSAAFP